MIKIQVKHIKYGYSFIKYKCKNVSQTPTITQTFLSSCFSSRKKWEKTFLLINVDAPSPDFDITLCFLLL